MLNISQDIRIIDGKLKCDICTIEKAIIRCKKCARIVYCSEECKNNDKYHKYVCFKDLSEYIYAIIVLHKMGQCEHSQCKHSQCKHGRIGSIMISYGLHNIKLNKSLTLNINIAKDMCILCGNNIYNNKNNFVFYNDGFEIKYQKCNSCLNSKYSICSKKLINNVICSKNENNKIILTIMTMKNYLIKDILNLLVNFLIKLKCCLL